MQNLFQLVSNTGQGTLKFPEWLYVRDGLKRNLGQVVSYYRNSPDAVESSHILVKLLHSLNVPHSLTLERYFANIDNRALNVSMALKMTSSIFNGKVFDGDFYGKGNSEILIAHDEEFDINEANRGWRNLSPVKVLRHPRSDLGLNLPNGHITGVESGLAVIAININLLAIQYRAFRLNENFVNSSDSQLSVMQFVHMYVLPNMLFSHLDYAIFNRLNNKRLGLMNGISTKAHSFFLSDYSSKVDHVLEDFLYKVDRVGKDFPGILQSIPAVTKNNILEVMPVPEMALTRQVLWSLVIARLSVMDFLFHVLRASAEERNQSEVNRVKRNLLAYKSDSLMMNQLSTPLYNQVQEEIDRIALV